jgi:hypothetical protein
MHKLATLGSLSCIVNMPKLLPKMNKVGSTNMLMLCFDSLVGFLFLFCMHKLATLG